MRLPAYSQELPFTYAFGRFAVAEALARRPDDVKLVLWHGQMAHEQLGPLLESATAAGAEARRDDAAVQRLRRNATVTCLAQVSKRHELLAPAQDHVVLVKPSHPGNVGTAIRSLVAFGFTDLALVAPRVDPWGAYVVRSSVGLRFALRCQSFASVDAYLERHANAGAGGNAEAAAATGDRRTPPRSLYLFNAEASEELDEVAFRSPFSLVFGPEWDERGAGEHADRPLVNLPSARTVRIPQANRVESLNLATSVSIAAYRARRPHEG